MEFGTNKLKQLKRRVKRHPHGYEPNLQLGIFYLEKDDYRSALKHLERACQKKDNYAELHFLIAKTYQMLSEDSRAETYFRSAIGLAPDDYKTVSNFGQFLLLSDRVDEAIAIYRQAIELQPQNLELLNDLGTLYFNAKDYQQAIICFKKALQINRDHFTVQVNLAFAYLAIHDFIEAQKIIEKLEQLHDFGCTLKAYKRGIIKNIKLYGEMHRFIPAFAAWLGVNVAEIPVNHRPRVHGLPKYNLSRVSRVIFDLVVVRFFSDYMTRPIQFFGRIAKILGFYGFSSIIALALLQLFGVLPLSLNTIVLLTAILMFAILQIISIGLLGTIWKQSQA
ncbi:MAG: tetratricopeptide repeat protein [Deltaproteobacteria bacterium]|jgi:type IV pilus biogenesis/stability protein PilW|nr:tetratricopeptide repeat protein [Deltaproteobacteria bacterium]